MFCDLVRARFRREPAHFLLPSPKSSCAGESNAPAPGLQGDARPRPARQGGALRPHHGSKRHRQSALPPTGGHFNCRRTPCSQAGDLGSPSSDSATAML
eukprot:scaffold43492_cov23-Tisochrysis_lutea.AAC.6